MWWESKRKHYNMALAVAGIVAFIAYAIIVLVFDEYFNQAEITLFTTIFQAIIYSFIMLIANLFYFLGHLSEKIIFPNNVRKFRKVTYSMGLYFSICVPFLIPASMLVIVAKKIIR